MSKLFQGCARAWARGVSYRYCSHEGERSALEVEPDRSRHRARRHIVSSAEGGQEIVERFFVGEVDYRQAQAPLFLVAVEQIVVADCDIEQTARLHPLGIVIVVLGSRRRDLEERGPVLGCRAGAIGADGHAGRGVHATAEQSGLGPRNATGSRS